MKKSKKILLLSTSILLAGAVGIGVVNSSTVISGTVSATDTVDDRLTPYYMCDEEDGDSSFSGVSRNSDAVYAGYISYSWWDDLITLSNVDLGYGIVSTTSGGIIKSITIEWDGDEDGSGTLAIFARNEAYTSVNDLSSWTAAGYIDDISYGTDTYTFTESYRYVGIGVDLGTASFYSVTFTWGEEDTTDDAKDAAVNFAQTFLNNIGCDPSGYGTVAPTGDWDSFKTAYENLSAEAQAYLVEDVDDTIDEFLDLYDYIIGKYNYDNFLNRTITSPSNAVISSNSINYEVIIAVVTISVLVIVSASIYFVVKKRKQASK